MTPKEELENDARLHAEAIFFIIRKLSATELTWKDQQYGKELRAYRESYLSGYKTALESKEVTGLKDALENIKEYWNGCEASSVDAIENAVETAKEALEKFEKAKGDEM